MDFERECGLREREYPPAQPFACGAPTFVQQDRCSPTGILLQPSALVPFPPVLAGLARGGVAPALESRHACGPGDAGWGLPRAGLGPAAGRRLPFRTVQAQLRLTWMHAEKALPLEVGKESLRCLLPPARSCDLSPRVPSRDVRCHFGMTLRDPSVSSTTEVTLAMSAWPCWRSAASISSRVTRCRRRAASR